MRDYLSLRFQRVVVGGETAELVPVVKGVPQGSVLGPTLFNIYLAHLPDLVSFQRVQIPSFADDVTLHSVANSINEAVSEVTLAVSSVGCNLAERGLRINFKKSCAMALGKGSSADSFDGIKYDQDFIIPAVPCTKLLAIMVDIRLSWKEHVNYIAEKVGRKIGAFHRASRMLNVQARRMYLISVTLPDFGYCCALFACSLCSADRKKLEALERRAVRICSGADRTAPCDPLYDNLQIVPLRLRWLWRILCLTFQAVKGCDPMQLMTYLYISVTHIILVVKRPLLFFRLELLM